MKRTSAVIIVVLSFVLSLFWSSCNSSSNSGGNNPPPSQVQVTVSPATANVPAGGMVQFSASVANATNTAVTWQVNGTAGGNSTVGTISSSGLYTAPTTVPNPATTTITAVSQADTTASGTASVTVTAASAFNVSPSSATVLAGATQQFSVTTVGGTPVPKVNWQVNGAAGGGSSTGTISTAGLYTAPSIPPSGQKVTVTAISQSDRKSVV